MTIGLSKSVFSTIYEALLIISLLSIVIRLSTYMPTLMLIGLEIKMILLQPAHSLDTSGAIQFFRVPRNNAQLHTPPLKPNIAMSLPLLLTFFGYLIYLVSSVTPLLRHQLSTTTMSVRPTSTLIRCFTRL